MPTTTFNIHGGTYGVLESTPYSHYNSEYAVLTYVSTYACTRYVTECASVCVLWWWW